MSVTFRAPFVNFDNSSATSRLTRLVRALQTVDQARPVERIASESVPFGCSRIHRPHGVSDKRMSAFRIRVLDFKQELSSLLRLANTGIAYIVSLYVYTSDLPPQVMDISAKKPEEILKELLERLRYGEGMGWSYAAIGRFVGQGEGHRPMNEMVNGKFKTKRQKAVAAPFGLPLNFFVSPARFMDVQVRLTRAREKFRSSAVAELMTHPAIVRSVCDMPWYMEEAAPTHRTLQNVAVVMQAQFGRKVKRWSKEKIHAAVAEAIKDDEEEEDDEDIEPVSAEAALDAVAKHMALVLDKAGVVRDAKKKREEEPSKTAKKKSPAKK
jgi:hypothetical protein